MMVLSYVINEGVRDGLIQFSILYLQILIAAMRLGHFKVKGVVTIPVDGTYQLWSVFTQLPDVSGWCIL